MTDKTEFLLSEYSLEDALPYLLNRAGVRIGDAFSSELSRFGITLPMWRVLASLLHEDGQRMTNLAEHTSTDISTLSRLVASVEKKELVRRIPAAEDRRSITAHLTEKGRQLGERVAPMADLYERIALANIPPDEVVVLKRLLKQIYANISFLGKPAP